ncbi:hypothetical protein H4Q26_007457 [Puccinia striiformis f. sp. tritici PST-130]|nr:hypothetical protein H4Q26_007457 [Puccinia striiformis f. sp. tritici PST-130]
MTPVTTIYRLPDDMAEDKQLTTIAVIGSRGSSTPADITRLSQISPVKYTGKFSYLSMEKEKYLPLNPNTSPSRIQQRTTQSQVVREPRPSSQNIPFSPANRPPSPIKRLQPLTKPPARPSSRPAFTSTSRATSPTKASSFKQTAKVPINPHASPTRTPLYNNNGGRNETGLGLNLSNPTPGRSSPTRQPSLIKPCNSTRDSVDSSLMNVTFVSAASGIDENLPPPSSNKTKDFKSHQTSILAGLGFSRLGNQTKSPIPSTGIPGAASSPERFGNSALKADERFFGGYDPKKEPLKAYLRIRPPNAASTRTTPYISILNDTEVLLAAPTQSSATGFPSQESVNAKYKFTRVYGPEATQQEFFQGTGLPLVSDLLEGKSSLCFAYGVTASGKTYTVQGGLDTVRGGGSMDPGLLPRTIDVLFNSIGCNLTELPIRPTRLTGIEIAPLIPETIKRDSFADPSSPRSSPTLMKDQTVLPIDSSVEFGIWISYAEVYNEKVYDLLDTMIESSSSSGATFQSFTANLADQVKNAAHLLHTKASNTGGVIKRKPLTLKHDKTSGNKYVHGLTEIRVKTAEEAKILLRRGQVNRTVFSTYANRTSSRSHGIFTIKVIKLPKNVQLSESMLAAATVSRLSIVDLAGSERTRNTQTTGQRLKEAGNINKSLMVLGQCMETLRKNQEQKEKNRKMTIVPFRHSKLTELFQSFFTGEGKTVMIVNVNPCDTGFDENSHVMKFSAVASEVVTVREEQHQNPYALLQDQVKTPVEPPVVDETSFILEDEDDEDEFENEDGDEDSTDNNDAFVDHLLEQVSSLRVKLVEAEIRAAMIESEVREQVMQEYNQRMLDMEALFTQNMANEAKEAELKTDRKIDIFNRATQHLSQSSVDSNEEDLANYNNENEKTIVKEAKNQSNRSKKANKKQTTVKTFVDSQKEADDDDPTSQFHQSSSLDHPPEAPAKPVRELRPRTRKS